MSTKPSFRGAPKYRRFLITTGPATFLLTEFLRMTSPALPPSSVAWAASDPGLCSHMIGASAPTWKEAHLTGYTLPMISWIPSRCAGVTEGSYVMTAQSASPSERVEPRSPEIQNLAPARLAPLYVPRFTL